MRKLGPVIATVVIIAAGIFGVIAVAYFRHHNADQITRANALAADLQKLTVGTSDFKAARAIATKFGTVPYENDWGTRDCANGYFERCAYMIPLNSGAMRKLLLKHPFLSHLGVGDWSGTAQIYIENGIIKQYSLGIIYRASNGQLRGLAAEEGILLPENRAVQAHISDAYSVQRNDILAGDKPRDVGFELEASLTPMASAAERKRAWNLNFACLVQNRGCGEICDVMPDAWRDFYVRRGHFDVEKYGPAYLFCKNPAP
ncbi:MAG: hypothetical protein WCG81_15195 [Candidatus Angelobacter sp.]